MQVSSRNGAPNDGTGKGEVLNNPNAFARSKQNSDATGFHYQWGRKDPFIFATSSIHNGGGTYDYGKYPVKIYNTNRELIFQNDNGFGNAGMTPTGGVKYLGAVMNSMTAVIKTPNTCYTTPIISQDGHSKELFNYYWTSYSRGVDGKGTFPINVPTWHNTYLDGYIALRSKSIYDPCPYGYRIPNNGTYNDFNSNQGWVAYSYSGGTIWNTIWFKGGGLKSSIFIHLGRGGWYNTSILQSKVTRYPTVLYYDKRITNSGGDCHELMYGHSVRCIEEDTEIKWRLKFYIGNRKN